MWSVDGSRYKERCIDFEEIFAWKARRDSTLSSASKAGPLDHTAWWAPLPDEIRKRVHFYNLPVLWRTLRGLDGLVVYSGRSSETQCKPQTLLEANQHAV